MIAQYVPKMIIHSSLQILLVPFFPSPSRWDHPPILSIDMPCVPVFVRYDCPTPRRMYEHILDPPPLDSEDNPTVVLRANPDCFDSDKYPPEVTFVSPFTGLLETRRCHLDNFPSLGP